MEQFRVWIDEILVALINFFSKLGFDKVLRPEASEETTEE